MNILDSQLILWFMLQARSIQEIRILRKLIHCNLIRIYIARRILCIFGSTVGIVTELRAGRSGDQIPLRARNSAHIQTSLEAHPVSCTMGTVTFPG
jgi:hypothetical protein